MTDDLITQAENALEGVTDGPWVVIKGADAWWIDNVSDTASVASTITNRGPDAEFIAAARSLVPELVAALKAAQAENELMYGRGYQAGVRQERENQEARR